MSAPPILQWIIDETHNESSALAAENEPLDDLRSNDTLLGVEAA
jgi:hypothetical protein